MLQNNLCFQRLYTHKHAYAYTQKMLNKAKNKKTCNTCSIMITKGTTKFKKQK